MDIYVTQKTKVAIRLIDSLALIVFYSSLVDFYYLGPYLLNLVSSIKYVCQSKEIKTKTINKNFMDINTIISDLIGFFNGFTRVLCQDYNCYLGVDAIYNERCFLHLRKNNNDSILVICREHSGSYEYNQLKSMGQIIPKNRNIIQNNEDDNDKEENKIKVKNNNILNYMKFKKNMKKKQYLRINNLKSENNNNYYNEYNNKENRINNRINMTMITNNIDLPSESQIFEEKEKDNENNNEYEQVFEVFDFINNVTKRNVEKEIKSSNNNKDYNNIKEEINNNIINKTNKFNENRDNYRNSFIIKNTYNNTRNDNHSQLSLAQDDNKNIQRTKTQIFNKNVAFKNMELINSINFEEDFKYEDNNKVNDKKHLEYNDALRESLMKNFNQINNNYIDLENTQSYEEINNLNYNNKYFRNNTTSINLNSNILNSMNITNFSNYNNHNTYYLGKNTYINKLNSYQNNNTTNNIYYPTNKNSFNNFDTNSNQSNNNSINIINNSTNINKLNNIEINTYQNNNNINYSTNNNNLNNNINNNIEQSLVPFYPPFNNNNQNKNNINNQNQNNNQFSQYDLSFLGGYQKSGNLKEDFLKINPSNPEIISELKEKNYYYYSLFNGCKLIKISSKGYIGINVKPPNIINNKVFYINILSEKWKDNNYFFDKDINKKIEQITGMIYKIQLQKQQKAIKLITYSINQNVASNIKIVDSKINIYNNQLMYIFSYNQDSNKFIQRIEIIVEYKNNFMGWNDIKSDGNITNNNNIKLNVVYNRSINEGKIIYPNNNYNILQYIKKINIMIQLKNVIISDMNIKINYSNAVSQSQESLYCKKVSLICFQYS